MDHEAQTTNTICPKYGRMPLALGVLFFLGAVAFLIYFLLTGFGFQKTSTSDIILL